MHHPKRHPRRDKASSARNRGAVPKRRASEHFQYIVPLFLGTGTPPAGHAWSGRARSAITWTSSLEFLGGIPLDISIREQTGGGKPTVAAEPEWHLAKIYRDIARRVADKLAKRENEHQV